MVECLQGWAEMLQHDHVAAGRPGLPARQTLVDGVVLAGVAHAGLHQRHMLVAIVIVIESSPRRVRIHDAHFDHGGSPAIDTLEAYFIEGIVRMWGGSYVSRSTDS